jgi:hypothetical protein
MSIFENPMPPDGYKAPKTRKEKSIDIMNGAEYSVTSIPSGQGMGHTPEPVKPLIVELIKRMDSNNNNFRYGSLDWNTRVALADLCGILDDRLAKL